MNFDLIAKDLLKTPAPQTPAGNPLERANVLLELVQSGFSIKDIFTEIRQLYDNAEDDILKKQLLDMVVKVHGLYNKEESQDNKPTFIFNITGSKQRVMDMLCPPAAPLMVNEVVQ